MTRAKIPAENNTFVAMAIVELAFHIGRTENMPGPLQPDSQCSIALRNQLMPLTIGQRYQFAAYTVQNPGNQSPIPCKADLQRVFEDFRQHNG